MLNNVLIMFLKAAGFVEVRAEILTARKSIIKNRLAGNRLKPYTIKPAPISIKPPW
jgi:hypothetical protein